uniref:Ovule protein n=1 Tax=Echinococcus granulosus TaxID=6210 RepID=A0A068WD72_ECHGR|nr:hypothetical protein EgrG_001044400 [Echinococcus granulosus]
MQSYPIMFHFFILETSDWRDQRSQVTHACKHLHNSFPYKHAQVHFFLLGTENLHKQANSWTLFLLSGVH